MKRLTEILRSVIESIKEVGVAPSADSILDNATKMYISENIQKERQISMTTSKVAQNRFNQAREPITEKQLLLLKKLKYKGKVESLSKHEAKVLIKEILENHSHL